MMASLSEQHFGVVAKMGSQNTASLYTYMVCEVIAMSWCSLVPKLIP